MSEVLVEVDIEDDPIEIEIVEAVIEISVDEYNIAIETVGGEGKKGDKGDKGDDGAASTVPGPPGPSAVSADAGNAAVIGSDSYIWVPLPPDQATLDARYVNKQGDTIPGLLLIDRGPGVGVPLLELRTNNGSNILSSDGSSYLTFSNGISVPMLFTGGIGFTVLGVQVDLNQGALVNVGRINLVAATSHIRNYSDYNAGQGMIDQGIIHTYANRQVGPDVVAFQTHKAGDITEQPFKISSWGYGHLKNDKPDIPTLLLRGASGQVENVFEVRDFAGQLLFYVQPGGSAGFLNVVNAPIVRVPGIDLWNDGHIYFAAQASSIWGDADTIRTNKPIVAPEGTDPTHLASRQYVDNKPVNLPPESDANNNTSYGNLAQNSMAGSHNTAVGTSAQQSYGAVTGTHNVAVGSRAQEALGGGSRNVALGYYTQGGMADGSDNLGIGMQTQDTIGSGSGNVAIGSYAQSNAAAGVYGDVAIGHNAQNGVQGVVNVAIGQRAQYALGTGDSNVNIGTDSGREMTTGRGNVGIGHETMFNPHRTTSANYQTAIGFRTGCGPFSGAVAIGADTAGVGAVATADNQIALGTPNHAVSILGSLTVAGVPVLDYMQKLETKIDELMARITELEAR